MPKQADEDPGRSSRIVLVGMMGSGKTTVGRLVASQLGVSFADADEEIESSTGLDVQELFSTLGEPAFRRARERGSRHLAGAGRSRE